MQPPNLLICLSACISIAGAYAYIRDTYQGRSRPNLVSWTMWSISPLIGAGAAIAGGADYSTVVRVFLGGFLPLLVVSAALINPQRYWRVTSFDLLCGGASISALILWLLLNNPIMAILAAVIGDGFASVPTLVKAWRYPETETSSTYLAGFLSAILVIPSIEVWDVPNSAFQLYLVMINFLLVLLASRQKFTHLFIHRDL